MNHLSKILVVAGALVLAACDSNDNDAPVNLPALTSTVQLLHASPDAPAVDVLVDGEEALLIRVDLLEPGGSREVRARFVSDAVGERRIDASARDERGWVAAGCFCGVAVSGLPALQMAMRDESRDASGGGVFEVGEEVVYDVRTG